MHVFLRGLLIFFVMLWVGALNAAGLNSWVQAQSRGNTSVATKAAVFPAVIIRGRPRAPQAVERRVSGEEARRVAGAGGDVIRAVSALPGVTPQSDYLSNLLVRGSGENDNLFLWDNFPLEYPFHFAGLESVVPAGLVDEAVLLTGGWDVRYGDAQGGVLELNSPQPQQGFHGEVNISAIQFGGLFNYVSGGVSATLSYRRGFLDWVLDPGPSLVGLPAWQDYFARLALNGKNVRFSVVAFGSEDSLRARVETTDIPVATDLAGDFSWFSRFNTVGSSLVFTRGNWQHRLQVSRSDSRLAWRGSRDVSLDQRPLSWQIRAESDWVLDAPPPINHHLNLGVEWIRTDTKLKGKFARLPVELGTSLDYSSLDVVRVDAVGGKALSSVWLQDRWQAAQRIWIAAGFRLDRLDPGPEIHISPRLFIETRPFENTRLNATMGDYYQSPHPLETVPGWTAAGSRGSLSRGWSVGAEQGLADWTLGVEYFQKDFERRLPRTQVDLGSNSVVAEFNAASSGSARGVEILLRLPQFSDVNGWISYTFTESLRSLPGRADSPADFNQPHVINAVTIFNPKPQWALSLSHRAASGIAYTPIASRSFNSAENRWEPVFGPPNSKRLPWYQRTDVRVEYTFLFTGVNLRFYYEVFNLFNYLNLTSVTYNEDYSDVQKLQQFPRIHFGGMEIIF